MDFAAEFEEGLPYQEFLCKYATEEQQRRWEAIHAEVRMTDDQQSLLHGFRREMKVLVLAGTWCGDCVNQCPMFASFAAQTDAIHLRFFDRDDHPELARELMTCGGPRVPAVLFLSEDGFVCGRYGDRTLSQYRQMVAQQTGAACPTGLVAPADSLTGRVVQEWLDEFERIQWMLQTSPRLRQLHGD